MGGSRRGLQIHKDSYIAALEFMFDLIGVRSDGMLIYSNRSDLILYNLDSFISVL